MSNRMMMGGLFVASLVAIAWCWSLWHPAVSDPCCASDPIGDFDIPRRDWREWTGKMLLEKYPLNDTIPEIFNHQLDRVADITGDDYCTTQAAFHSVKGRMSLPAALTILTKDTGCTWRISTWPEIFASQGLSFPKDLGYSTKEPVWYIHRKS